MQLMIQRGQRIIIFPVFNLWAKFELNPEEGALIAKYRVRKHILVQGKPLQRLWAAGLGILIASVIAVIAHSYLGVQLIVITLLVFVGSAFLLGLLEVVWVYLDHFRAPATCRSGLSGAGIPRLAVRMHVAG